MNGFILAVTIALTGSPASTIDAKFSSEVDCESARRIVQKQAALFAATLRKQEIDGKVVIGIPEVAAVCKAISN
jgi:hypothetical protein